MHFELDPRLEKDAALLGTLPLSQLRLMRDARFAWVVLVPMRANVCEWFDLAPPDQIQLHQEVMAVAQKLKTLSVASKINIGALGNIVRQLHVHIIARHEGDACWPGPVWGTPMHAMAPHEWAERVQHMQVLLR
jgi:diadenosine tetraphosphate (Ap4A) HIT family hydrolase